MSRGCWHIILAIGLISLPCSGQAQDEEQGEQGQTATQQQPAPTLPIPLLVDIIEDEAAAEARKRREAEARQNQKDDLVAQQGMDRATQAMQQYSYVQTWLIGSGTALLIVTLLLTLQANLAAREAVKVTREIGEKQLRAYLFLDNELPIDPFRIAAGEPPHGMVNIKNFGQTPAYDIVCQRGAFDGPWPIPDNFEFPADDTTEWAGGAKGPDPEADGVVRWRRIDLKRWIEAQFGVVMHERTVGKQLAALGYRRLSARPQHPKADPAAQQAFKKNSPKRSPRPSPRRRAASLSRSGSRTKQG